MDVFTEIESEADLWAMLREAPSTRAVLEILDGSGAQLLIYEFYKPERFPDPNGSARVVGVINPGSPAHAALLRQADDLETLPVIDFYGTWIIDEA
jgi:hypothetical protein